jgi:hypothetical protein
MKCKEVQSLLVEWLDGHVDSMSRDGIGRHLKSCPSCSQEARDLKEMIQVMDGVSPEIPSAALRENFYSMLQSEQNLLATEIIIEGRPSGRVIAFLSSPWIRAAAVAVIFALGFLAGEFLRVGREPLAAAGSAGNNTANGANGANSEITRLRQDVKDIKEVLMFNLLANESASERIQAMNYAEEISHPDSKVLHALIHTLNNDKNVNVRLASLYSLDRFSDEAAVRDSLVESLKRQKEPLIQVMLINMLAEKKESRAVKPIQDILSNDKTLKEVKEAARKGLRTM